MVIELTPSFKVIDARFRKLAFPHVHVEKLYTGCRWAEGPAWFPAGRYLVWSDIPNDRMLRWDETDGSVSVFRQPAMNTNGHTVDLQGRLVSCEHRGRCVSRTEHDGSRTVLASHFEGKRLNSPNDVVVKSDGSVWFSDPSYGIDSDYEGDASPSEQGAQRVYRLDPASGALTVAADDFVQPNGLAFSPDESLLYIADTGVTHVKDGPRHVRKFRVDAKGTLTGGEVFATCPAGVYDGFRVDVHGNLWLSAGDGVHCHASDGALLGKVLIPETVSNVCFGGAKRNRLFICGTTSLYAVYLNTRGAGR
ncbi:MULTISPECIES: SMP-30/gluconolactonase/LRE family protein [Sorangium]|uniref:Gnl2 protein n=1 Tax=Sorangium cellulosum (strain So ce56) TaxID=448385 RepID=A9FNA4_SORC5|nr:SMP-30/gluconolactonase/LRE family protein [Sorangium cellulosum]CAN98406.1 gnl2 [Sorangium cellulosum So ce56]